MSNGRAYDRGTTCEVIVQGGHLELVTLVRETWQACLQQTDPSLPSFLFAQGE